MRLHVSSQQSSQLWARFFSFTYTSLMLLYTTSIPVAHTNWFYTFSNALAAFLVVYYNIIPLNIRVYSMWSVYYPLYNGFYTFYYYAGKNNTFSFIWYLFYILVLQVSLFFNFDPLVWCFYIHILKLFIVSVWVPFIVKEYFNLFF